MLWMLGFKKFISGFGEGDSISIIADEQTVKYFEREKIKEI